MASTFSVSKGCFVFNKKKFVKNKGRKSLVKQDEVCDDPWFTAYKRTWKWVEEKFETLRNETFSNVLNGLVSFVDNTYQENEAKWEISNVPTAALLTGINMPDHGALFSILCDSIHKEVSPHVATLHAHKCKTIRQAVEQMTSQFMNAACSEDSDIDSDDSDEEKPAKMKKSQCNMLVLQSWYQQNYPTYFTLHNKRNSKKRKGIELNEVSEDLENCIKRQKLDNEVTQSLKNEFPLRSPRKHYRFQKDRMNTDEGEESVFSNKADAMRSSNSNQTHQSPNNCKVFLKLNENGNFLQSIGEISKEESELILKSPQKVIDKTLKASKLDLESPCKKKMNSELSKAVQQTPQKTPKKDVRLADPLNENSENERRRSSRRIAQILTRESPQTKPVENRENLKHTISSFPLLPLQNDKKSFCQWNKLIVIIPEFEKFSSKVLQDFILILRSSIPALPIVLIMGIATSVAAVHRSLPYRMSACLSIKVFQSPPSVRLMNSVLEEILFSPLFPFRLGNKTFCFLIDAFLFYDLSVKGFVQAMKFCMMEHFCGQNWKILCCKPNSLKDIHLTANDIATLRELPSFVHYMKNSEDEERKKIINDDEQVEKTLLKLVKNFCKTKEIFHIALKCLNVLAEDLPKAPLGKQVHELYGMAASSPISRTPEYKECFQLLGFLSRDELITKMDKLISILDKCHKDSVVNSILETIGDYKAKLQVADICAASPQHSPRKAILSEGRMNRHAFKEKLMQLSKKDKRESPFERKREEFLTYLSSKIFPELLKPLATLPLAEVFMFDNTASVRTHIIGAPRAAIHTALNDPEFYLECECCVQPEKNSILASMPDICIAYKLYRECGRFINLYDWLQAFSAVVCDREEEKREIEPLVQARFTRAVAELQFMGFLKTSSRKVDHVTKLYFDGGC